MAVTDRIRRKPDGPVIPRDCWDRMSRGRDAMQKDANLRRLCHKFWSGDQYFYIGAKGVLLAQDTVTRAGGGKPPHRIRNTYNFVHAIVEGKVSASTQRVPGYEVTPSTGDRMDEEAAIQAAQVATYGYDKWRLRRVTTKVVTNALVQREGFALPYFDQNVGPFKQVIDLETGDVVNRGRGEVKVLVLSRSEVYWEPGVDFDDSRWHCIERATPVDEVKAMPGYDGKALTMDATTRDVPTDKEPGDQVLVTTYLERPCPKYPQGRRMVFANGRMICPVENYPAIGPDGEVVDEPALHRLSYTVDPDGDDRGMVENLIDLQRTVNDCWNKLLEWKNRALNPQMSAHEGAFRKGLTQVDDVPGAIRFWRGQHKPEWETAPAIPRELFEMLDLAVSHMRAIAADVDVQALPDVAAKSMQAAVEQGQQRWQSFLGDLAEFHSRLMRHCLALVAVYYDEPRQIELQGQYAPYTLQNFTGQDLRSQISVRVSPGSLVTQSRAAIREEVQMIQTLWPGAVSPEAGIAALHGGVGSNMIKSYQNHVGRAWRMVRLCEQGMEALSQIPRRFDPDVQKTNENGEPLFTPKVDMMTGQPLVNLQTGEPLLDPVMGDDIPGWMPRKQDNIDIWMQVFGDFMTTPAFERLSPDGQHVFDLVWDALEKLKTQRMQKELMDRQEMAAGQGLDNAAKPQAAPPLPDRSDVNPK